MSFLKKIVAVLLTIVLLLLLSSGIFSDLVKLFSWLFVLQYSFPDTSIAGGIVVRVLTFLVSYSLVGLLFSMLGWFNSKLMSLSYFVISTLLAFLLSWVVWMVEKYILFIGLALGITLAVIIGIFIYFEIRQNQNNGKTSNPNEGDVHE